jgi:hypothetical protein
VACHPERDPQFEFINDRVRSCQRPGQPAVSVDTKKKDLLDDFRKGGREWQEGNVPSTYGDCPNWRRIGRPG